MDFIPKKTGVYKELEWLAKAKLPTNKKERFALDMICCQKGTFYACDGYRLHSLRLDHFTANYEDGLYNLYKTKEGFMLEKDGEGKTYPNVERIIPTVFLDWGEVPLGGEFNRDAARLLKALPPDTCVMLNYLEDAGSGHCRFKDKDNPILIENGDRKAVIMPMEF